MPYGQRTSDSRVFGSFLIPNSGYNNIDGCTFAFPCSADGESFFGVIESHNILEMKESIRASTAAGKDKLSKIFDGMNEFDNPIIVKMKK
jgi:hypothetical protein